MNSPCPSGCSPFLPTPACNQVRRHPRAVAAKLVCLLGASALLGSAWAAGSTGEDEEELAQAFGDQATISIATGAKQPISRAPAVATVITAADIEAMGATDLDEVLETVPGFHVARSTQGYSPLYVVRGVNLGFSPQVLVQVNGVPLTAVFAGNRGIVWGSYPVHNIARIEVLRGPGSALYGADAVAGVINIITKSAADIDGTVVGARTGSFHTHDGWALHGGQWGPVQVAAYVRVGSTEGARSIIEADAQTGFDALRGTHASLAPGPVNNGRDFIDGQLDLSLENWRWRLGLNDRDNVGSGPGIASALDPRGTSRSQRLMSDLSYDNDHIAPNWALNAQLSALHYSERSDLFLYPAGAKIGGVYTDGMMGNPYKWERHHRLGATATYSGWQNHRIRLGLGAHWAEMYKIKNTRNSNNNFTPIGTGSLADLVDVSETRPFIRPHSRQVRYAYVQDEWQLVPDWTLTAGLRHDDYSDFGNTTNPRLALVWDAAYNLTAKLMAGSAFRPPSFTEMFAVNNPVVTGNPNLKAEKTHTVEAAVSWQATPAWQLGANVYHFRMDDIIQLVSFVYQNTGKLTGNGVELESAWTLSPAVRLSGNYSYQYTVDGATSHDAGSAPHHQVYARLDWRLPQNWSLHTQVNWISDQTRVLSDTRSPLAGYNTLDVTLRTPADKKGWSTAFSIRNLLDADVREPTTYDYSAAHPFISLPNDLPMPGRSFYVQGTYRF
ncbi:TonB-dependent receptor [Aquabacterium sp.]|uniref:TonB-dependent receptor plug domain-containing protein n=1 Tax=Aquabacterium sp. TaxID=1872578 RepID=UPI002E31474F|nr:TonB-dependent receptor [Aquabacterium sp.]HEX5310623.1 TonB-dependent receptor [Aquabacterium sp.]